MGAPGAGNNIGAPRQVFIRRAEEKMGFMDYRWIMEHKHDDVTRSPRFQRIFNRFYVLVYKQGRWLDEYYRIFEEMKTVEPDALSFELILRKLGEIEGSGVEASFASKMLATLNDEKPIWDTNVRTALKERNLLNLDEVNGSIDRAIREYSKLERFYEEFMRSDEAVKIVRSFDELFEDFRDISDVKKVDFYFWSAGAKALDD